MPNWDSGVPDVSDHVEPFALLWNDADSYKTQRQLRIQKIRYQPTAVTGSFTDQQSYKIVLEFEWAVNSDGTNIFFSKNKMIPIRGIFGTGPQTNLVGLESMKMLALTCF
jgi:hypothetical protein